MNNFFNPRHFSIEDHRNIQQLVERYGQDLDVVTELANMQQYFGNLGQDFEHTRGANHFFEVSAHLMTTRHPEVNLDFQSMLVLIFRAYNDTQRVMDPVAFQDLFLTALTSTAEEGPLEYQCGLNYMQTAIHRLLFALRTHHQDLRLVLDRTAFAMRFSVIVTEQAQQYLATLLANIDTPEDYERSLALLQRIADTDSVEPILTQIMPLINTAVMFELSHLYVENLGYINELMQNAIYCPIDTAPYLDSLQHNYTHLAAGQGLQR
jgi:hypothetical protein